MDDLINALNKFAIAVNKIYWPIYIPENLDIKFQIFTRAKAEIYFIRYFEPDLARWIAKRIPRKLLSLWL